MALVRGFLCRLIALTLLRHHMQQDRAFRIHITDVAQNRQQMVQLVTIHRAHVKETQFFKQGAAGYHAAGIFLHAVRGASNRLRKFFRNFEHYIADRTIGTARNQA